MAKKAKAFFDSLGEMLDDYLKEGGDKSPKETKKAPKKDKKEVHEKSKPVKDENAPKKPLTAFMLYCAHRRAQMKAENPSTKNSWNE